MSEEEIIKYVKDEIEEEMDIYYWFDDKPENRTRKQVEESIKAHQGLLDLYNKEKEKNNKLKNKIIDLFLLNNKDGLEDLEALKNKMPVDLKDIDEFNESVYKTLEKLGE